MRCFALALALAACATASASGATIKVTPSTVQTGHKVRVHGKVAGCTGNLTLISRAFPHRNEFAGVPAIFVHVKNNGHYSRRVRIPAAAGNYTISGRCGGGNIGAQATLHVTN